MIRSLLKYTIVSCVLVHFFTPFSAEACQLSVDLSDQGELIITGDNEPSSVLIRVTDQFTIWSGGGPFVFDVLDITSVTIQLGDNVDELNIQLSSPLLADLSISTGKGSDYVTLTDRTGGVVVGNLTINTGHGDDYVGISSLTIFGDVDISTGHGRDLIQFNSILDVPAMAGPNDIVGNLSVNTGVNGDQVRFYGFDTNVEHDLILELGQGNDTIYKSNRLVNLVGGIALLSGGQGTDTCPADPVTATEFIKIGFEN